MTNTDCKNCPVAQDISHCNAACVACQHGLPPPETRGQITPLGRNVEDKLLGLFNDLSGLHPLKAALLLHLYRGGTLSTFGSELTETMRQAARYGENGPSRSLAHAWYNDLEDRFGWVIALHNWRARGEGRHAGDMRSGRKAKCPGRFSGAK